MRMGKRGITTKLSFIDMRIVSTLPPRYPAISPTITAITLDIDEAIKAIIREFLMANVDCQNKSCPWEVVPNMWGHLGGKSRGTTFHLRGL